MALEQKLRLKLAQRLVMTPSLQQAIKLLQLSRLELEEALSQEILENPILDVEEQQDESTQTDIEPEDIEGTYTAGEAAIAIAGGGKAWALKNAKGVVLKLSGKQMGIEIALDVGGMSVKLKDK